MATEADVPNRDLWVHARERFHAMMLREVQVESEISHYDVARAVGILEAATVVEGLIKRAEAAPQPCQEVINLLTVLMEQIASLVEHEGGNK